MSAKILDGKAISKAWRNEIREVVQQAAQQGYARPGLAVVLVGEDCASQLYVKNKRAACEEAGFYSVLHSLPENIAQSHLLALIHQLNQEENIHGILVQRPLPVHIEVDAILDAIAPQKDVDGFNAQNLGLLLQRRPLLSPCTPKGIMYLLAKNDIGLRGLNAVVVGASNIVGRPMAIELLNAGCTVTVCHRATQHLSEKIHQADLVVAAMGQPKFIQGDWIKEGAIVIDVGINRYEESLVGDVDFESAKYRASWITPVPGGVGPMTIAALLDNTLIAATSIWKAS